MSDAMETIHDILGMPTARPILGTASHDDELAAQGDGLRDQDDWRPEQKDIC